MFFKEQPMMKKSVEQYCLCLYSILRCQCHCVSDTYVVSVTVSVITLTMSKRIALLAINYSNISYLYVALNYENFSLLLVT